jgi:hypothetical protein
VLLFQAEVDAKWAFYSVEMRKEISQMKISLAKKSSLLEEPILKRNTLHRNKELSFVT